MDFEENISALSQHILLARELEGSRRILIDEFVKTNKYLCDDLFTEGDQPFLKLFRNKLAVDSLSRQLDIFLRAASIHEPSASYSKLEKICHELLRQTNMSIKYNNLLFAMTKGSLANTTFFYTPDSAQPLEWKGPKKRLEPENVQKENRLLKSFRIQSF